MEILHCRNRWKKRFVIRSDYGSTGCRQELRLDPSVSPQNTCFKPPLFQEPIHAHVPSRCHNEFIFYIIVFMWFMCMFGGGPCSTALQLELVWFLRSGRLRMRFAQRTVNMSRDPKNQTVWWCDLYSASCWGWCMMWLNSLHSFSEDLPGRGFETNQHHSVSTFFYSCFLVVSLSDFQTSCMASKWCNAKPSKARSSRSWNRCSPFGLSDLSGAENFA